MFVSVLMQHKEFLEWPLLLTERLQENNQPRKKSMFVQVQINKTGWVTKREWKGSGKIRDGNNPKMAKRRNTGSLREGWGVGGGEEHMDGTESALRQEEGDKNRWYPSTSSNLYATKQVEMKTSLCFWRFQREGGRGKAFPMWLSWTGSPNQACMDGGDPLCLPHPSRSADPGAGKGKGCTTWKL